MPHGNRCDCTTTQPKYLAENPPHMSFVPPTEEELSAVARLNQKLIDENAYVNEFRFTETGILRFYRGRKQDEEKAYKALLCHINWRQENNVDNISNDISKFQKELDKGKFLVEGKNHVGYPIIFIFAKKHDKNNRDIDEMRMNIIYVLEELIKQAPPAEERIVICFDLSGFSYTCMDYEVVKMLINILQFNYPDILHHALVVNAPFLFSACWAIIRPWLDPVTAGKVLFVSFDQLSDHIPTEHIPINQESASSSQKTTQSSVNSSSK